MLALGWGSRMKKICVALAGVIALGGCTSRPWPDTRESERKVFYNYLACIELANRNQGELETFVSDHPGKEMTPKEEFTLSMLTDRAKNGVERCEAHMRSETQMLRETDRGIDSLRPRTLYVVP